MPLTRRFIFDARKRLHAGHVGHPDRADSRVVLVAFTTLNAPQLDLVPISKLLGLGFPLPSKTDPHSQMSMNDFAKRLRQVSISA